MLHICGSFIVKSDCMFFIDDGKTERDVGNMSFTGSFSHMLWGWIGSIHLDCYINTQLSILQLGMQICFMNVPLGHIPSNSIAIILSPI